MVFVKTFDDLGKAIEFANSKKNSQIVCKGNYKKRNYSVTWNK